MCHAPVFVFDSQLAETPLALFDAVADRVGHGERYRAAVRRPSKCVDALLAAGQLLGFTAGNRDAIELPLAVAIGDEREPLAIGRPGRLQARFARIRDAVGTGR